MNLDHRTGEGGERIVQGPGVMGERAAVDDDGGVLTPRRVNGIHEITFVIGLLVFQVESTSRCVRDTCLDVVAQGVGSVNLGLSLPEQIQVRAVEKKNRGHDENLAVEGGLAEEGLQRVGHDSRVDSAHDLEPDGAVQNEGESSDRLLVSGHALQ